MLWLVFAALTLATLAVLGWPLWRPSAPIASRRDVDRAVYRAQLAELDADLARGLLAPDQAGVARIEVQRRMLAEAAQPASSDDRAARRAAAIALAVMLPLCAGLLYASHGNPRLPDAPYAERLAHDPKVILADAAARMETGLAAKPSIEGYRRLAEFYLRTGDPDRAGKAQKRAIQLGADGAADWSDLGEIAVIADRGVVGPEALAAFATALVRDRREPRARFYAGLAEAEIGDLARAVAIWRDLEQDSLPGAPWLPVLRRQIAAAATSGKFDPKTVPPAPPSPQALATAAMAMSKALGK